MVTTSNPNHEDNRLLAALPREMLALMARDLRHLSLSQGHPIYEPGTPIDDIYFPQSGMISLMVVVDDWRGIEISTIGREGAVGLHAALGKRLSFTRAVTQIGGRFSTIRTSTFAQHAQDFAPVRELIIRYTENLWAEAQQLAGCNAVHDAPARLCRWLLHVADRIGSDQLPLTQELIAQMLGVRRTTVTILAQALQQRGAIKYARGRITIVDRDKLMTCACECYTVLTKQKLSPVTF